MNTIQRTIVVVTAIAGFLSGCAAVAYDVAQKDDSSLCIKRAAAGELVCPN